ncbi:MAG: lysozyme inhibitor LprI family protein, partial [Burkholderiales bacterium]
AQEITVSALSYYDFDGDGNDEAIFVGASCFAGTGGPDVHGVYRLSGTDRLVELEIPESIPPLPLAGNRNFLLYEQEGFLVREYYDSSDRKKPLIEFFRWRNGRFWLERMQKSSVFEAGFDCRKARSDAEITICGHEDLARTDRELGERYKAKLQALSGSRRSAFVAQQKHWLQKRNSDCTYKWIRECLLDLYRKRMGEIEILPRASSANR